MNLKFEKYEGLGNDFIIIEETHIENINRSQLAREMCHRKFGIGADGMIICKLKPEIEMVFYNADGSRAPMCGNGIRCFGHYLKEKGHVKENQVKIQTLAGQLNLEYKNEFASESRVAMGQGRFNSKEIPLSIETEKFVNEKLEIEGQEFEISALYMGTTHSVIWKDNLDEEFVRRYGPKIETHKLFPQKTNVNFVEYISSDEIKVITWERGAGLTLACGTGACAAVLIGNMLGRLNSQVKVHVLGGEMFIEILPTQVYMTGPSRKICSGEYNLNQIHGGNINENL